MFEKTSTFPLMSHNDYIPTELFKDTAKKEQYLSERVKKRDDKIPKKAWVGETVKARPSSAVIPQDRAPPATNV